MIKPDGVQRQLIGEIIQRFEKRGMKIIALKLLQIDEDLAEKHYKDHVGKKFYQRLMRYITSGPVVVAVIEGLDAIQQVRRMVGSTLPSEAAIGTIRADYGQELPLNIIHASDSSDSARREMSLYFEPSEILEYKLYIDRWIFSLDDNDQ